MEVLALLFMNKPNDEKSTHPVSVTQVCLCTLQWWNIRRNIDSFKLVMLRWLLKY